jgi:hypothetical protein
MIDGDEDGKTDGEEGDGDEENEDEVDKNDDADADECRGTFKSKLLVCAAGEYGSIIPISL